MKKRCEWATSDPIYIDYHDQEWGKPTHDDQELFELLCLEGAQAGLSWITILKRRENYRKAFDNFDPKVVQGYSEEKIQEILQDAGIIRNKLKVRSVVTNAKAFLQVQEEFGSFDAYIWDFVDGAPILNDWSDHAEVPATTDGSQQMSKDLKKRGFKFVGPTICYAYMQSAGLVNDHTRECFLYHGG